MTRARRVSTNARATVGHHAPPRVGAVSTGPTLAPLPLDLLPVADLLQRIASAPRFRRASGLWFASAASTTYLRFTRLADLYRERHAATRPGMVVLAAYRDGAVAIVHVEADTGPAARFTADLDRDGKPGSWTLTHPAPRLPTT